MYKWTKLVHASRNRAFYGTLLFLFIIPVCHAILVNRTIDDTKGDSAVNSFPIYQPASLWEQGCSGCYIQPETMKAFDGTWSAADTRYRPDLPNVNQQNVNVTLRFIGVAVWVFFILANAGVRGTIMTNTQVNITFDGKYVGNFSHYPDMNVQGMTYNATVFSKSGLDNVLHEVVIWTNNYTNNSFFTFDWAIYTVNMNAASFQSTPSSTTTAFSSTTDSSSIASTSSPIPTPQHSSSKIAVIVGCTIGGLAVIILILVFLVRRSRRAPQIRLGNGNAEGILDIDVPPRHQPYYKREIPVSDHGPMQSKAARLRQARQMELDERVRSAQHELDNLRSLRNARSADDIGDPSTAGRERPSTELALLRNEMQQLRDRMGHLQAQRESDWALGLSDELPPAYTQLSNNVQ